MSDEEEDLPQDVKDLQRDIIIDLLSKTKRRLKRSVWDNLKLAFRYERGKRLDPENPEDKEKLQKIMPADYFVKKGIHGLAERITHYGEDWFEGFGLDQYGSPLTGIPIEYVRELHEKFQERKVSRALEDAKHFARRVEKSPIGTGTKKFSSAVGPAITNYTEKLAGYNEDWLQQFGYKDGIKFSEVEPPKATSDAVEFLKKVPREVRRDFGTAFHYTKGKRLDSKNPEDEKILKETEPFDYVAKRYVENHTHYNEKNWFNKYGITETGKLLPKFSSDDFKRLNEEVQKYGKSAAYEALKNLKIGKYGWSDLGRSLYHGVEKIGDGILYFPRRHWERERREIEELQEISCGLTDNDTRYVENRINELEAADEARKIRARLAQQGQLVAPTAGGGPLVFYNQPQINLPSPGEYKIEFKLVN